METALFIALQLSKALPGMGSPENILFNTRTDIALSALDYIKFNSAYEAEYIELNTKANK